MVNLVSYCFLIVWFRAKHVLTVWRIIYKFPPPTGGVHILLVYNNTWNTRVHYRPLDLRQAGQTHNILLLHLGWSCWNMSLIILFRKYRHLYWTLHSNDILHYIQCCVVDILPGVLSNLYSLYSCWTYQRYKVGPIISCLSLMAVTWWNTIKI